MQAKRTRINKERFDFEKLNKDLADKGITYAKIAEVTGYDKKTISRYFGGSELAEITEMTMRGLLTFCDLNYLDYILEEEKVEEKPVETVQQINVDLTPVLEKLDLIVVGLNNLMEIEQAVNKLGNVSMQNLEYTKQIMDEVCVSSGELKKLNDKWNKPGAYKR